MAIMFSIFNYDFVIFNYYKICMWNVFAVKRTSVTFNYDFVLPWALHVYFCNDQYLLRVTVHVNIVCAVLCTICLYRCY